MANYKEINEYLYFQKYLNNKKNNKNKDFYDIEMIDLFFVNNFKGGGTRVQENLDTLETKLKQISEVFKKISETFDFDERVNLAEDLIRKFGYGKDSDSNYIIKGFRATFLGTLLHFYFPETFAIIDRYVLLSSGIIDEKEIDNSGQVKNIENFYREYCFFINKNKKDKSIREFEIELFEKGKKLYKEIKDKRKK